MFKHYYRCHACGEHIVSYTVHDVPWLPARTHDRALATGDAEPAARRGATQTDCIGELTYCSGWDVKNDKPCSMMHRGSEELIATPQARPDPDWVDFCSRVSGAWNAFVLSGYDRALRGVNNHREYRPTPKVKVRLQSANGTLSIDGAAYTISDSQTAGVSLKRPIPAVYQQDNICSFIFHL